MCDTTCGHAPYESSRPEAGVDDLQPAEIEPVAIGAGALERGGQSARPHGREQAI